MALKSTVFKADLQVNDLRRHYYQQHSLTIAQHPSETDERMMVRILTFALFASEQLQFTKGISADDEPDLWEHDLTGNIVHWIDLGQPDEKRVRKACHRAQQVTLMCYGGRTVDIWWQQQRANCERFDNLRVLAIAPEQSKQLAALAQRSMRLQCTIDDDQLWIACGDESFPVQPILLFGADLKNH